METASLLTPPVPRLVPARVFDGFAWCASDTLPWRRPARFEIDAPFSPELPERLLFVLTGRGPELPRELAWLHAPGQVFEDEWALAPYAIDDATDGLFESRIAPRDAFSCLVADNLNALVWGLHDWCHFHNHGPFEERALTELQCDATAAAWLTLNADVIGVSEATRRATVDALMAHAEARFLEEGAPCASGLVEGAFDQSMRLVTQR